MLPQAKTDEVGPDGVEPSSGPYKEPALTIELRAPASAGLSTSACSVLHSITVSLEAAAGTNRLSGGVRPEGVEPSSCRLKVCCVTVTPRPPMWSGVSVSNAEE